MITLEYTRFKMRAECTHDVTVFLSRVPVVSILIERDLDLMYPDVDVTFVTNVTLDNVRRCIAGIPDGHVMLETVELESNYTGERKPDESEA